MSATVSIAGTILLGEAYGAQGAAVAVVAAEGAVALASLRYLGKASPGFAPHLGVVPKVTLATAAGVGIAIALPAGPRWCSPPPRDSCTQDLS